MLQHHRRRQHPQTQHPWLAAYAHGVAHTIGPVRETLPEMLEASAQRFPRHVALEFFGAETTYRDLWDQVQRVAHGLHRLGVRPQDRVALILPNCPQLVVAFYAALRLGATVVLHNPLYTDRELRHQFEDHEAQFAIAWDAVCDTIAEFPTDIRPEHIVSVNITRGMRGIQQLALRLPIQKARAARHQLSRSPRASGILPWRVIADHRRVKSAVPKPMLDDIALIQYTSGTTGSPRGAMLSHRNLRANAMQSLAWVPMLRPGKEIFYGVLPLFHAYGMTLCLSVAMSIGARLVLFPAFDIGLIRAASRHHPPTFFPGVPPMYERLIHASTDKRLKLSSVKVGLSGAMALPPAIVDRWEAVTGGLLIEGYGMTETSPIALGNPIGPTRRPGTVGVPFPSTEVRIVSLTDPTQDVAPGERGELLIRGPQVFAGYWNNPDATAAVILDGGWLRTGDVVTMSNAGFVTVVDRLKELIITGGFNVAPAEVESIIRLHPDVDEVAVIALPRNDGSEIVTAVIVVRPDSTLSTVPQDDVTREIRAFCRPRLAAYKIPRTVVVVHELPRSLIGKVVRREVRAMLADHGIETA